MELRANFKVVAEITVDDAEAEVLHHLCSYGLADWFAEKRSSRFTAAEIMATLHKIRDQSLRIIRARNRAIASLTQKEG